MNTQAGEVAADRAEDGRESISGRLRALLPNLSATAQRIGQVILADPSAVVQLTVTDVAARSNTSVGSVVRFCQDDLELRGFQDLKLRLAADGPHTPATPIQDVTASDPPAAALAAVLNVSATALTEATRAVTPATFNRAVDAIGKATHLLLVGVGTSAPLAQDAAYRFRSVGIHAETTADTHMQHVMAQLAGADTVALAISHTGQTRETLTTMRAARTAGATCIAITSFARSPLTELCDLALIAGSAETHHQVEAMTSRLVHLAILDALRVSITLAQPERAERAQRLTADALIDHRI
ncbi:MAG: SIS domain-containing protein [Streptosporangiales bacterium]|nr:SIS domain-containing protein [Streptosporangiales bacterium]